MENREQGRDAGPAQVGRDHDPAAAQPVGDRARHEPEQHHRGDLEGGGNADLQPRAGDPVDKDDDGDGIEGVAPLADRAGRENHRNPGERIARISGDGCSGEDAPRPMNPNLFVAAPAASVAFQPLFRGRTSGGHRPTAVHCAPADGRS